MKIVRQFGKKRGRSLRGSWAHWTGPRVSWGKFPKVSGRETRTGEVHPERTVGTLFRSVSPGDSTGADRAWVNRARVGVNVTADGKKHKNEKQRRVRYIKRSLGL